MAFLTQEEIDKLERKTRDGIEWYVWGNGGGLVQYPARIETSAQVYGGARVYGDARVYGGALVYGQIVSAQSFLQYYGLGNHCLTAVIKDNEILITKGCFEGNIEKALTVAKSKYTEEQQQELALVIELAKFHFREELEAAEKTKGESQ